MMILQNVLRNKLHQELVNGGVGVTTVFAIDDSEYGANITFDNGTNMELVQQIIDAHDPTPIPALLSETELLRLEMARSNAEMFEMVVSLMTGGVE